MNSAACNRVEHLAIEAGATREEIAEAVRVAYYISGVGSVYTAAQALKELF